MRRYISIVDDLLYGFVTDMKSFRNKIVIGVFILCFKTIHDNVSFGISAGLLGTIVTYYFYIRNKSECDMYKSSGDTPKKEDDIVRHNI